MGKVKRGKPHNKGFENKKQSDKPDKSFPIINAKISKKILHEARHQRLEVDGNEIQEHVSHLQLGEGFGDEFVDEKELYDNLQLDIDDERILQDGSESKNKNSRNLCNIILEKMDEYNNALQNKFTKTESGHVEEIDPRVRQMYEGVRDVMKRYRSGKVPKAFKIIPKLRNWEQVLLITEPFNWSAAAMYQGTRIFSSALSQNMAQKFYNLILLPRIRDDLCEYKKLNVHLYNSLKKALFKPAAFMKGIVIPLLESGDCTLREAVIFGSVIAKSSIPVLHSSACLLKICEMEHSSANSIFIRIFFDKRYALPYRVIDAAVFHFLRMENLNMEPSIFWHQSFLTFVQRYKNDISTDQKFALMELLRKKQHPKIGSEIRRELLAAKCRDAE